MSRMRYKKEKHEMSTRDLLDEDAIIIVDDIVGDDDEIQQQQQHLSPSVDDQSIYYQQTCDVS